MKGVKTRLTDFPRRFIYDDAPTLHELSLPKELAIGLCTVCSAVKRETRLIQLENLRFINEAYYIAITTVWGGQRLWNDREIAERLNIVPDKDNTTRYLYITFAMAEALVMLQPGYKDIPNLLPPIFEKSGTNFPQFREWVTKMAAKGYRLTSNLRPMPCDTSEANLSPQEWLRLTNNFDYQGVDRIVKLWPNHESQHIILMRIIRSFEQLKDLLGWSEKIIDYTRHNLKSLELGLMTAQLTTKSTAVRNDYHVRIVLNELLEEKTSELNRRVEELENEVRDLQDKLTAKDEKIMQMEQNRGLERKAIEHEFYDKLVNRAKRTIILEANTNRPAVYRLIKDLIQGTFRELSITYDLEEVLEQALIPEERPAASSITINNHGNYFEQIEQVGIQSMPLPSDGHKPKQLK